MFRVSICLVKTSDLESNMLATYDREWFDKKFDELRKEVVKVQIDVATLKVKAGVWGLIGGSIPLAIMLAAYFIEKLG